MAPNNRPMSLPAIPDIALDLDDKTQLLPELDEVISAAGESSTALDDDYDDFRPVRSHSTYTQNSLRRPRVSLPTRYPSVSSSTTQSTYTSAAPPLPPRRLDLTCDVPPLQLPPWQKTLYEGWTITYHHARPRTTRQLRLCGLAVWRRFERDEGAVLSVVPNTHFSQDELAATIALHEASVVAHAARQRAGRRRGRLLCKPPSGRWSDSKEQKQQQQHQQQQQGGLGIVDGGAAVEAGSDWAVYAADLEKRVRALDWAVQDEIYELLSDRVQSSSNAFRRRDWRVVAMSQVPGGELTDAPTGLGGAAAASQKEKKKWFGGGWRWRETPGSKTVWDTDMPVTEYRLIIRGTEVKGTDHGWPYYNRYSRPWRIADEKEIGERRRWSGMTGRSEKYVDF